MVNEVIVNYPSENSTPLMVKYRVSQEHNIHTIECKLASEYSVPSWLQSTKFIFNSIKSGNHFSLLFEDMKFNKNIDTILFMDMCYEKIMTRMGKSFDL